MNQASAMSQLSQPLPLDVRLMNRAATALFLALALGSVAAALWWAARLPVFAIGGITVLGDVQRNNALSLRANVAARLEGNFFSLDLNQVRSAFEAVPWVRSAQVQREFPNHLRVLLHEHQAVAYWGEEGGSRMLNNFGEVFEANTGELDSDELPRLSGPNDQAAQVLATYRALTKPLALIDAELDQLELSAHGNWRAQLDSGAVIELGRGGQLELVQRLERFTRSLTQAAALNGRSAADLESADLRHTNGYALRLREVTTSRTPLPASARAPAPGRRG